MAKGMIKNKIKAIIAACALAVSLIGTIPVQAAPTYNIEFRAGSQGEFKSSTEGFSGNNMKITKEVEYGGAVKEPGRADIEPKTGYWFTGWNTEVENTVTEKAVYVAQYARLINALEYRVNYVDTMGVSLATQRIAYAEKGESFDELAEKIEGYAPDAESKRVTITEAGTEVTFVYTSTLEPNVVTNTETETVTETVTENVVQNVPGGTTGNETGTQTGTETGTETGTQTGENQPNEGTTVIPNEEVPLDNTEIGGQNNEGNQNDNDDRETSSISDEEVPKADKDLSSTPGWIYGALGGAVVALGAIGAVVVVLKRKRG